MVYEFDRNKLFSVLFSLTGFNRNVPAFLEHLKERGFFPVTENQIRSWRRSNGKGNPVPDFVFKTLFELISEKREQEPKFFVVEDTGEKGKKG
ncbi:hypothetical protein [Lonepinella sp. BR2882]|uniref:hypothetical protein n=1 Tax=Lonepinella sp. BR2882 TaxID=3095283 RepID=UPI003F6E18B2